MSIKANPNPIINREWKDGEFDYCARLVNQRGDDNVGHTPAAIADYLLVQAISAERDGEPEIARRLQSASRFVSAGNWIAAERAMGF